MGEGGLRFSKLLAGGERELGELLDAMGRGTTVCAMGVLMMIPVPGTNTLPAAAALLTGLGVLYRDGLWSSLGIASGLGLLGLYGAAFWGALRLFHLFP